MVARGGIRKRLAPQVNKKHNNDLRRVLISKYSKGQLSAPGVGEIAHAASASGSGALTRLEIETSKKHANRQLTRHVLKESSLPTPYVRKVPLWDSKLSRSTMQKVAVNLPHEILDSVVNPAELTFDDSQKGFQQDLLDWGARLGVDVLTGGVGVRTRVFLVGNLMLKARVHCWPPNLAMHAHLQHQTKLILRLGGGSIPSNVRGRAWPCGAIPLHS